MVPERTPEETPSRTGPDTFATELERLDLAGMLARAARSSQSQQQAALLEPTLSLESAAILLKSPRETLMDSLMVRAKGTAEDGFGRSVLIFAPFFLSNFCVNYCRYCSFSFKEQIPRRWLSPARAAEEVALLAHRGFKRIVLVAGEYPSVVSRDYVAETLRRVRPVISEIDLDLGPVEEEDYRAWKEAGAGGIICFQETYDPAVYADLHPRGPKSRYEYRLATLDRAARAGIDRLGLGVLLGVGDSARDILSLIAHARYLERLHPKTALTITLPRVTGAVASYVPAAAVVDEEMLRMVAVLRIALPRVGLVASAREPAWLRERLLSAGITQMSTENVSETSAYVECQHDGGDAQVLDHRSVYELKWDIEDLGYRVHWTGQGAGVEEAGTAT